MDHVNMLIPLPGRAPARRISKPVSFVLALMTLLALLAFSLLFASCVAANGKKTYSSPYAPRQMAEALIFSLPDLPEMVPLPRENAFFNDYVATAYGLDASVLTDGFVFYANGVYASEIAVFLLDREASVSDASATLTGYIKAREGVFAGYAPGEAAILKDSIVSVRGVYIALLICADPARAEKVFLSCFSDNPPPLPDSDALAARLYSKDTPVEESHKPEIIAGVNPDLLTDGVISNGDVSDGTVSDGATSSGDVSDGAIIGGEPGFKPGKKSDSEPKEASAGKDDASGSVPESLPSSESRPDSVDKPAPGHDINIKPGATNEPEAKKTLEPEVAAKEVGAKKEIGANAEGSDRGSNPESASKADPEREAGSEVKDPPVIKLKENKTENKLKLIPEYGRAAIVAAYENGDLSALSLKQKAILEACQAVIVDIIRDDMSVYEKELAIHDWLINWISYDEAALSNKPGAAPDPDSDNPYGALINKKAICSGYTSTFKLFMDLLSIECVIVEGGTTYGEEHAWNMVRVDGKWYHVDVTWDDPIAIIQTESMKHKYFNVPDAFMTDTKHEWDASAAPKATSPKLYSK